MDDIIFAVYMHVGGWRRVCFHHLVDEFPALKHLLRVNVFDCLSAQKHQHLLLLQLLLICTVTAVFKVCEASYRPQYHVTCLTNDQR